MNHALILILSLLLCGCAEYSAHTSLDGLSKPSDLIPQPFPSAPPEQNQ